MATGTSEASEATPRPFRNTAPAPGPRVHTARNSVRVETAMAASSPAPTHPATRGRRRGEPSSRRSDTRDPVRTSAAGTI